MANLRGGEQASSWLEAELARQLCPVSAPDSLWRQIHEQRRPLRVRPNPWTAWSLAAAALLMLVTGIVWRLGVTQDPGDHLVALAEQELRDTADGSARLELRSSDPGEIQRWVKAKLGVDVRLTDHPVPGGVAVRLLGAGIARFGASSAAVISYRVGDDFAEMLVTERSAGGTGSAGSGHSWLRHGSAGNLLAYSWSQGADDYAIAFGSHQHGKLPCLACHADRPALMIFR